MTKKRTKNNAPPGWHTVTPRIFVRDTAAMVRFLKEVFEAEGEYQESRPTELRVGDSIIMVSNVGARGSFTICLYVYVADLEKTFARAVAWSVEVIEVPLDTPYGDRRAVIKDEWGNMWQIAQANLA